jgi:hypothetical protein
MGQTAEQSPRHILIYGPPAAGKLTVARCLAGRYNLKLLDNHLTLDVALRLFSFGTKDCWELVERMRLDLLEAAGRAGLNVVSTLVFSHPDDRGHISRLLEASDRAGAVMSFVQLRPRRPVLEERVIQPSRQGTRKVGDVAVLGRMLEKYDLLTPINEDDFSIDNSEASRRGGGVHDRLHGGNRTRRLSNRAHSCICVVVSSPCVAPPPGHRDAQVWPVSPTSGGLPG